MNELNKKNGKPTLAFAACCERIFFSSINIVTVKTFAKPGKNLDFFHPTNPVSAIPG